MSRENVKVVRTLYERYSEGDFRAAADVLDPHVVLVLDPGFAASLFASPVDDAFYGIDAVASYTRGFLEDAHVTMEAEEVVAAGDSVLVAVHQRVTGKRSGVPTESRYFSVWSFRGPKVIRIESFGERADALRALGLTEQSMAKENVERFLEGVAAFNRGDLEAWVGYIHPDVVFEPIRSPIEGPYRGHAGVRRFFAENRESFESFRLDYTDVRDLGDERLLAIGTLHLRAPGSGIETDVPTAAIATSRDGLLIHWNDYGDPRKALQAAGQQE